MPRVTVIPSDRAIGVDGAFLFFDFQADAAIHAIQWDGSRGHIEYTDGRHPEQITDEAVVAPFIAAYNAEVERLASERAALENSAEYICDQIDFERDCRIDAGFLFRGKTIQSRPDDRENIAAKQQRALMVKQGIGEWDASTVWITEDNSLLPLPTPDDMLALGDAAEKHKERLIFRGAELKARIRAGERFDFTADEEWAA